MSGLPLVDVSALCDPDASAESCAKVGREIDAACRDTGFLLVTGHGIDRALRDDLERLVAGVLRAARRRPRRRSR